MVTPDRFEQRAGLLVRDAEHELLLLDPDTDRIHRLNETAALVWHGCAQPSSASAIARTLAMRYDVEEHVALQDATAALDHMVELGLVVRCTT